MTRGRVLLILGVVLALAGVWALFRAVTGAGTPQNANSNGPGAPRKPPPPVNMVAEVGQANYTRKEALVPVRVTLNANDKPISGRLELTDLRGHRTSMPIEMPRQGNKVYTLFAPLSQSDDPSGASAELACIDGNQTLVRQSLIPVYPDTGSSIILSATGDDAGLQFLHDKQLYFVSHRAPKDLPRQWAGYEPADVVAINGRAWTGMDEEQRRAFRMWVEQGGHAVLCGEATTEWRDPDGQALAGITPSQLVPEAELEAVQRLGGAPFRAAGGSVMTVSGPLAPGATVIEPEGGRPLIVSRPAVLGKVTWLGFDPFRESMRGWEGFGKFWRGVINTAKRGAPAPLPALETMDNVKTAASALPRLPVPPMAAIVAFGVVYALIFGPLNIWILRRLRRTVRSWLFMPTLALVMTLVVLFAGQMWGNARTVLNSLTILQASNGGRSAHEQTLVGFFSPTNRVFDLSLEDAAPDLYDVSETGLESGPGFTRGWPDHQNDGLVKWDTMALQLYSIRLMNLRRPRDLNGAIDARLNWPGQTRPTGTITNGTGQALRGAYLYHKGWYQWIGDLPAGGSTRIAAPAWRKKLAEDLPEPQSGGLLLENRRFRDSVRTLWSGAKDTLLGGENRQDAWLVAECAEFRSGLEVSGVPYSNNAAVLLVRIPR